MIPILYERNETAFSSNGLGRLNCIRCIVVEERNGVYECEFDVPVTDPMFSYIEEGRIIACTHDEQGDIQPFEIYGRSEPINGIVTFYAHHISYRLSEITVKPFTAGSCVEAMSKIRSQSVNPNPFTFWTNKSVTADFVSDVPKDARSMLAGSEGSILDVYGTGEYEYDKFLVKLHLHRGQDTNVSIRYGKNLIDYTNQLDASGVYTAVVPYWIGDVSEETEDEAVSRTVLVTLPEWYISSGNSVPSGREIVVPMDLSDEFEEEPSVQDLREKATSKLQSSKAWLPVQTIAVDFVQLWQTDEYADYAVLQRLRLCDTCGVFVPMYNTAVRAKVIRTEYNVLQDRYDRMELGDQPTTYTAVMEKIYDNKIAKVSAGFQAISVDIVNALATAATDASEKAEAAKSGAVTTANAYTDGQIQSNTATITSSYQAAIASATEKIRGGQGGYIVTVLNASGQPIELLITDNINLNQAVNVWRWNSGGLGHSHSGYNGPYDDVAITQDGKINASMILTGALTANLITAGTIKDATGKNTWNLESGQFVTKQGKIADVDITSNGLEYDTTASYMLLDKEGLAVFGREYGPRGYESTGFVMSRNWLSAYGKVGASKAKEGYSGGDLIARITVVPEYTAISSPPSLTLSVDGSSAASFGSTQVRIDKALNCQSDATVIGDLTVTGTKNRLVKTQNYGSRLHNAYETPTPLFGDVGEAKLDEEGICYVDIDDIFSETIELKQEYQVFLQKEGKGDCWIAEKDPRYFVIQGTPGLKVAWELKAKQRDYDMIRLEQPDSGLEDYSYSSGDDDLLNSYIAEQEDMLYGND